MVGQIDRWMEGQMDRQKDGQMDGFKAAWMGEDCCIISSFIRCHKCYYKQSSAYDVLKNDACRNAK